MGNQQPGANHASTAAPKRKDSRKPSTTNANNTAERTMLYDSLVAFYYKVDNERLLNGDVDVDGITDWGLSVGMDELNAKLRAKYGDDLDTFLFDTSNIAVTPAASSEDLPRLAAESQRSSPEKHPAATSGEDGERGAETEVPKPEGGGVEGDLDFSNEAAESRPVIPAMRRRPTATQRFTLNPDGTLQASEQEQLDHKPPPDLRTQLEGFLAGKGVSDGGASLAKFLKISDDHGLVALNSELLNAYGEDLRGNTMSSANLGEVGDGGKKKHFGGVGVDERILEEMQRAKLKHEDSNRSIKIVSATGTCDKFRLDTSSSTFGMCKCGAPRAQHFVKRSSLVSGSLERKLNERQLAADVPHEISSKVSSSSVPQSTASSTASNAAASRVSNASMAEPLGKSVPAPATPVTKSTKPPPPSSANPAKPSAGATKPPPPTQSPTKPSTPTPGGLERLATPDTTRVKAPQPCSPSTFVLDMGAAEFGCCANCGWKKSEHGVGNAPSTPAASNTKTTPTGGPAATVTASASSKPASGTKPAASRAVDEIPLLPRPARPMSVRKDASAPKVACDKYRLDVNADTFGVCVCGFARQAHKGENSNMVGISRTLERRWKDVAKKA